MEERWIPYSSLWWRIWTPAIGRGERYHEGCFCGYVSNDEDDDGNPEDMAVLDIRRMLAMPFVRALYKKLPYIDVVPVRRPWDDMDDEQRRRREAFVIASTMAAYDAGKALYPRETIREIEDQLHAAAARTDRAATARGPWHRLRRRLYGGCEAPQTAWVRFAALDGVRQHTTTWAPGAEQTVFAEEGAHENSFYTPGRSQIEFRKIQELTMPDPDALADPFVPDGWQESVAYNPIVLARQVLNESGLDLHHGAAEERVTLAGLMDRMARDELAIAGSPEWRAFTDETAAAKVQPTLKSIDKIVFFYATGLADDSDFCRRALFLLALVARLRNLVRDLRGGAAPPIPIYMPAYDPTRSWTPREKGFLHANGVVLVEPNGELFLKVDARTVVVSYRNRNPVKQVVADLAKPAVLICRPVSADPDQDFAWAEEIRDGEAVRVPRVRASCVDPEAMLCDQDSPRTRRLVRDYERVALPELPAQTADREVMSMYVRRADVCTRVEYW
ncbi:hypothetical protein BT67DRAFT_435812 [Trichocladium antarcticum]|uniref:Uncharacterized protein n=1 Tax=Trichocladium antarcticum TaxID=1450529 RepID=A0AAN6ZAS8_9PEZI|nr:hypothetical protein BT67DRAFT_435812 [Trichocladium antarcticum]